MKPLPLCLEPAFVHRIWGARSLAPLFPEKTNLAEAIGEVWLTGEDCRFASGPWAGQKLGEAWPSIPAAWKGTRLADEARFPLLVKFLFPEEKLSIQVHPSDAYAEQHEAAQGGRGKTEMWYAIAAREGAEVFVGLKPGVTAATFRRAIADSTIEDRLERIPVHASEAIFVPAGTVHTIGAGMVLCEIQEYSDITYRVFDYNRTDAQGRPRELHVERALEAINFGEQSGGGITPVCIHRGAVRETYFVACRYFATEEWEFAQRIGAATSTEHFDLLIVLDGSGRIEVDNDAVDYARAQAWLLPATLGAYHLVPRTPTTLLRTYVPDIVTDFVQRLADQRIEESAWSRLVYP